MSEKNKKEIVVSANISENIFVLKLEDKIIAEGTIPKEPELIDLMEGKKLLEVKPKPEYQNLNLDKEASREIAALLMMERMAA